MRRGSARLAAGESGYLVRCAGPGTELAADARDGGGVQAVAGEPVVAEQVQALADVGEVLGRQAGVERRGEAISRAWV